MAQPTGAFSSYDSIGNREDLSDIIFDVSPTDTPVITAIKKKKATATNHEWQTDILEAAANNAHIEGNDAAPAVNAATVRLSNQTQIFKKHAVITGTQEKVDKAGRKSEMAYQVARRLKAIKRDLERAIMGVNNAKVVGNDTTAREMASIQPFLTTNTAAGTGGSDGASSGGTARTDGTQRALTEALLETVLQSVWDNSGDSENLMLCVGSFNKGVVSNFTTGAATRYVTTDDKKLVASIDVYVGDFQTLKVVPNRFYDATRGARDALVLNPDYIALAELRPTQSYDLAKTGDSFRKEIVEECTLEMCQEAASGGVFDLTTS